MVLGISGSSPFSLGSRELPSWPTQPSTSGMPSANMVASSYRVEGSSAPSTGENGTTPLTRLDKLNSLVVEKTGTLYRLWCQTQHFEAAPNNVVQLRQDLLAALESGNLPASVTIDFQSLIYLTGPTEERGRGLPYDLNVVRANLVQKEIYNSDHTLNKSGLRNRPELFRLQDFIVSIRTKLIAEMRVIHQTLPSADQKNHPLPQLRPFSTWYF